MKRLICLSLLLLCFVAACNRDPNAAKQKYVENGNKYFERGKYKEALIMYRNALKRDMRFGEAYYRAALANLKLQRFADAVKDLQRAVELQPQNLDAHNRLTNLYLNVYLVDRKRPKRILEELDTLSKRYSERFPNSFDDARLKGYLALFASDTKGAITQFERANELKPFQPDLVLVLMQTLTADNRAAEGEKLALAMLDKDPSALSVYDALFLHYLRQNRPQDAETTLKRKLEKNPKVADPYLQLAAHHFAAQRRPEMMAVLNKLSSNKKDFPSAPLLVGDFFLRTRDYDQAGQLYKQGIDEGGKTKALYQKRMIEVLIKQNKKDEANQLVAEVLKENPNDHEAIAIRASLSLLTGSTEQLQSAINDLQSVISKMPENPVLRYNLGRAHLAKGNVQAARVQFEEAIKLRPDYLLPRLTLAQLMLQNREFAKVVQMSQEILVYEPGNVAARLMRSRALIGMGETKQARTELAQTSQQFPDLPEARLQVAALDLQDKNFKTAEEGFRKVYGQSHNPRAFLGLVETLVAQGQQGLALKTLRDEISKSPERLEYRVALANLSVAGSDFPTAIAEYKHVIDKAPRSSDIWLRLGETYRLAGDAHKAAESFNKAKELAPNNPTPYLQLALMYDTSGQKMEAKPLYEQILRLQPDNAVAAVALNNLAYMLAESGSDLDQALSMAQRARQMRPNDDNVADTLGWIYIKKNLSDSAITVFRDLVQKSPERATYRYHLAMALFQKGDKLQAKKECELALRSRPEKDEEAKIRELMSKLT